MSEQIVDVECNKHRKTNCAIRLDGVSCDGYGENRSIGVFTHFHEDHIGAVTECIASYDVLIAHPTTFEGIVALKPGIRHRQQWVQQDFGTTYHMPGGYIQLLKANHIPGSSQVYVEMNGKSMLYSGDFNFPDIQIKHADYMVIDATHGDPWHDGQTDRRSVKNRMFENIEELLNNSGKPIVIQTSSGTLQEIIWHFEIGYGRKMSSDITFVMDEKQARVLNNIYKSERNEFRTPVNYESREFWNLIRANKKCIIFSTGSILDESLRSFYKIIIDQFRFSKERGPIIPFEGGCRYNLAAHASIENIYSYVEAVQPKYVITDYSRSTYAKQLAKLIGQKFPNIRAQYRPPWDDRNNPLL